MKCNKCGTILEDGSNICPNCQNIVSLEDEEEVEELDTGINENMAPPSLEVTKENLTEGVTDINTASTEIYEDIPTEEIKEVNIENQATPQNVNFAIPSVSEVVENADSVTGVVSESDKDVKKKFKFNLKGSVPALYFLIISFACLVVGILIGKSLFSSSYISTNTSASEINTKVVSDGKNNQTYLDGILYTIPTSYLYDKKDSGLLIYDKSGNVRMFLRLESGSYDNMAIAKTSIKETLKDNNFNVNSIEEKKITDDGKAYIIIEAQSQSDSQNRLIAFRKYNDEKVFYMEIVDTTNNYNNDALSVLDDIINNVKEEEGATIENLNIKDISKLVITASNEYKSLNSN